MNARLPGPIRSLTDGGLTCPEARGNNLHQCHGFGDTLEGRPLSTVGGLHGTRVKFRSGPNAAANPTRTLKSFFKDMVRDIFDFVKRTDKLLLKEPEAKSQPEVTRMSPRKIAAVLKLTTPIHQFGKLPRVSEFQLLAKFLSKFGHPPPFGMFANFTPEYGLRIRALIC